MNKQETTVFLKCDCDCSMLVVDKSMWYDGEINYNITVQDSRYDHNHTTLWGRIKSASKILFGKHIYYSDVYINKPEKFREFVGKLITVDFLTKELRENNGEVPQFYVEGSHVAIISSEEFDMVQDEMAQRKELGRAYSDKVFHSKLICGDCGGFYGGNGNGEP